MLLKPVAHLRPPGFSTFFTLFIPKMLTTYLPPEAREDTVIGVAWGGGPLPPGHVFFPRKRVCDSPARHTPAGGPPPSCPLRPSPAPQEVAKPEPIAQERNLEPQPSALCRKPDDSSTSTQNDRSYLPV